MSHTSHFKKGQHLFVCDQCGMVHHSEKKKVMWNGLVVGPECYELRNAQDFVRGRKDEQSVREDARPEQGNKLLVGGEVTSPDFEENVTPETKPTVVFLEPGDVTADDL